jgi:alpha-ribazole phosphatase
LARELHPEPVTDPRLMEMAFGTWERRPWDEIGEGVLTAWAEDMSDFAPPAGESARMLQARVLEWLGDLVAEARDHEVVGDAAAGSRVVVTHGGVIRALAGAALGLAPPDWFRLHVDFAALTVLEWPRDGGARPRLLALNR